MTIAVLATRCPGRIAGGNVPELEALTADVNFAIANLASR
jgi:hypothetical protein